MGGDEKNSATPAWTYSLTVDPGTHDLLAIGADTHMSIARDVAITAAGPGPNVTVDSGPAVPPTALTLNNLDGGGQTFAFSGFGTQNGEFFIVDQAQGTTSVTIAPASLLLATDFQFFEFVSQSQTGGQLAFLQAQGSAAVPSAYDLIPALAAVTFTPSASNLTAMWTTLPAAYDTVGVQLGNQDGSQAQNITASKSYVDKTATTTLAFDTSAPGYKSVWAVDPSTALGDLGVNRTDAATGGATRPRRSHRPGSRSGTRDVARLHHVSGASRRIFP